tara:strand:- start:1235 stop:1414 length:180 start_codon:yes stop_codon:yes gene_type:complete
MGTKRAYIPHHRLKSLKIDCAAEDRTIDCVRPHPNLIISLSISGPRALFAGESEEKDIG